MTSHDQPPVAIGGESPASPVERLTATEVADAWAVLNVEERRQGLAVLPRTRPRSSS